MLNKVYGIFWFIVGVICFYDPKSNTTDALICLAISTTVIIGQEILDKLNKK